jgi:hypothetical protein
MVLQYIPGIYVQARMPTKQKMKKRGNLDLFEFAFPSPNYDYDSSEDFDGTIFWRSRYLTGSTRVGIIPRRRSKYLVQ